MLNKDLKDLGARWKMLGIHLGFTQEEIDRIDADVNHINSKTEHCFPLVLGAWLKGQGDPVNKETLVEAIKTVGFGNLAREIEKQGRYIPAT